MPVPVPGFCSGERSVLGHADQHRDDAGEQVTCLLGGVGGDVGAAGHDVKDGGAFRGRPAGDPIEAALLVRAEFASSLRHVENDRRCGPVQLVLEMGAPGGQLRKDGVALVEKLEGALIDVEAFVIELHAQLSAQQASGCQRSTTQAKPCSNEACAVEPLNSRPCCA